MRLLFCSFVVAVVLVSTFALATAQVNKAQRDFFPTSNREKN